MRTSQVADDPPRQRNGQLITVFTIPAHPLRQVIDMGDSIPLLAIAAPIRKHEIVGEISRIP